jgi:threonine/homoserine/homoserine lactone efflux protein
MIDTTNLFVFIAACLVLLVTPGPAVLYIVSRTLDQGYKVGIASALGLALGSLGHIALIAFGMAALLAASVTAFSVIKYAGAAYLIFLGIRRLIQKPLANPNSKCSTSGTAVRAFWQGAVVNLLNPKAILFFLAFIPQFVDVSRGHIRWQLVILGLIFTTLGVLSDSVYVLLAGSLRRWIVGKSWWDNMSRYLTGSIYIGLGVLAAAMGSTKK